ncbi:MAG: fused MFS/spermidine synthase [Gammaproteobacteria bacterium]
MLYFASTIFISAFLLFQVQPIIGRYILPWFGGSAAVWTVCMLFFQVMLLAGYAYSHFIRSALTIKKQILVHCSLLIVALLFLPITPDESMIPDSGDNPVTLILVLLFLTIGLPFGLVSASAPLFQHWFNRCYPDRSPYRLYALSNAGSLLALLSYPFLVEPMLTLDAQAGLWSAGFVLFALGTVACARTTLQSAIPVTRKHADTIRQHPLMPGDRFLWLLLAFCGSVLLLATTSRISQDVAVVPFLWILPLSLYLLSFILCFDKPRWYQRRLWFPVYAVALLSGMYVIGPGSDDSIILQIASYSLLMFAGCMVCHGELVRSKPHPEHLTAFYLYIAAGGALGGAFVGLIAPLWFNDYLELPLVWTLIVLSAGLCLFRDKQYTSSGKGVGTQVLWGAAGGLAGIIIMTLFEMENEHVVDMERNFYGVLRIQDIPVDNPLSHVRFRKLLHGSITHGAQVVGDQELSQAATTYYAESSGIGIAIAAMRKQQPKLDIGVVGLGVGTMAALTRIGDHLRFYEINPQVVNMAKNYFTYLRHSSAEFEIIMGDARISMDREQKRNYDVLAIDAFSGDAIPVHLLTEEAFGIYLDHLRDNGILAVHISNRHLDLRPVIYAAADAYSLDALTVSNPDSTDGLVYESDWVLLGRNLDIDPDVAADKGTVTARFSGTLLRWTDNYSNLLGVLE